MGEGHTVHIPPPFLISFAVTRKCNLKCKHCYSDALDEAAPDELSTEEIKGVLDEIAGWGVRLLIFDGGEPLCREDFLDIARYASSKGLRVVIGSNGTLIDEEAARRLKAAGVMAVQISIDGAVAQTHDDFRGEKGAFEGALRGAEACRRAGLPFQFGMTIRRGDLREIPDMLRMAVEYGASAAEFFDLVRVERVKREIPDEALSPQERREVMELLAEAQRDCPIIIRVPACPMYPLLLKEKRVRPENLPSELLRRIPYYGRGCAAGMPNGYIQISPNGDVHPCMLLQVKVGNVREKSIRRIWEGSPILAELRDRSLLKGACGECRYRDECAGCRGRAYEEMGDMLAADPGCWMAVEAA